MSTNQISVPAWGDYLSIARVDHWFKNVFVLPGIALAILLADVPLTEAVLPTLLALMTTCLIASANYTINEWLDAEFDRHHPLKHTRPGARGRLRPALVLMQYIALAASGLLLSTTLTREFTGVALALLTMGILYNVPPVRTKDRAFLDVLSEAVNNPLRLLLGWFALVEGVLPPSSILLAYWMGGCFLMAVKRYAEYRYIGNSSRAADYRRSFGQYSEQSLLLSSFFYAICSAFFLGVFLIKYRIEFLLSFPFFAILFVWYLEIGMKPDSEAQRPENLHRNKAFVAYVIFLPVLVTVLFLFDIPILYPLMESVRFK